jgi:hypothetical protein
MPAQTKALANVLSGEKPGHVHAFPVGSKTFSLLNRINFALDLL